MKYTTNKSIIGLGSLAGYVTKILILGMDMIFAFIALSVALLIIGRFDFSQLSLLISWGVGLLLALRALSFIVFRTYLIIVRYIGEKDYKNVFYAVSFSSFMFWVLLLMMPSPFPKESTIAILLVDYFVLLLLTGGMRIVLRLLFDRLRMQSVTRLNTVILGAGELGSMIEKVLKFNISHNYKVVAFFDDNENVHKKFLNGIRIYNPKKSFEKVVKQQNIKYAIIGVNKLPEERRIAFIQQCLDHQIKVLKVPPTEKWLNNQLQLGQLTNIKFEDLLNRPPIKLNQEGVSRSVKGKVVLVTGAAGSIGSEIVRQILAYEPKLLIGLDQAESPLVDVGLQHKKAVEKGIFLARVGDVRDPHVLAHIFSTYRPEYVFHAAAYKHVPIMEHFPSEAIKVNVGGTKLLADFATQYEVKKFVMVSTDKAVNPSNVMGASKRIAEIYVQALNKEPHNKTQFITTRFGNVLGSNGSVIPIFKRQIEQGKPLTVTHENVTRFFMTIPEACQLVLEAGAMGNGGEIFIFDMGEPVRIIDLARTMIQMAGLTPGEDIEIKIVGLRPGEKLYEELLDGQEGNIPTHHPKIKKASVRENDYQEVLPLIEQMMSLSQDASKAVPLVASMKTLVPEFTSMNSDFAALDKS